MAQVSDLYITDRPEIWHDREMNPITHNARGELVLNFSKDGLAIEIVLNEIEYMRLIGFLKVKESVRQRGMNYE